MKYDTSGRISRSAGRVLAAFYEALFALLERKPFESITVQELCAQADYPRSTFYNYFDDIYDLLEYCWARMEEGFAEDNYRDCPEEERAFVIFDDLYTQFEEHRAALNRIFRRNKPGGKLMESINGHLQKRLAVAISDAAFAEGTPLPGEMLAEHCRNIIQLVFEWSFLREDGLSRREATEALRCLIGGLIRT